ncbi:hypothetical protein [Bacillus toyonensis]|uniref:hypothetical protein n=1 Tax=Bacillus toyonensis TaxID=155322 RepID=UPI000BF2F27B|nr:hypothetical protein [Bacillus toyonensis]PEU35553.1 hypothetical protein CN537_25360 [Bacillus toyonensis]
MSDNVTFTMQMNGVSKDATSYVKGIGNIAVFLLANTDKKLIDSLLSQVGEEEKMFINSALLGIKEKQK